MELKDILTQTPCYLIDEELLKSNLQAFQNALEKYWNNYGFGYSVKTNPLPWILTCLKDFGCMAEVVSDTEYELAEHMGFKPRAIIFNGPIKGHDKFLYALQNKSIVNIDSRRELTWLKEAAVLFDEITVGLRVNFDLEAVCPEESLTNGGGNRFGFNVENGAFQAVLKEIAALKNVRVAGLHMHTNSKTRSLSIFEAISRQVCSLAQTYGLRLDYIDIGGSFFVKKGDFAAYDDYIRVIASTLSAYFHPEDTTLIIEPGSAIISTPVSYLTKVLDVKDTHRSRFVVTDGGRLHIDPFMRKTGYVYEAFDADFLPLTRAPYNQQIVCGFSCMETDRIMTLTDVPELQVDDYILYDMTGGYTMSFNALFIEYLPKVFVKKSDHSYLLVRDKWGIPEFLQKNTEELK